MGGRAGAHLARARLDAHGPSAARTGAGARVVGQPGAVAAETDLRPTATLCLVAPERLGAALLVGRALVGAALVAVVVVGVVVAEAVDVVQRVERTHRRVRRMRRAAVARARVLGLARRHLRLPPEVLPDLVDERVQQPVDGVARRALDVRHVTADERVHETVVGLELRVLVHSDVGVRELFHHVRDVVIAYQVLTRRSLRRWVGGGGFTQGAREGSVPGVVDVLVVGALQGVAAQALADVLTLRQHAPAREVTDVHIAIVVAHILCGERMLRCD